MKDQHQPAPDDAARNVDDFDQWCDEEEEPITEDQRTAAMQVLAICAAFGLFTAFAIFTIVTGYGAH